MNFSELNIKKNTNSQHLENDRDPKAQPMTDPCVEQYIYLYMNQWMVDFVWQISR